MADLDWEVIDLATQFQVDFKGEIARGANGTKIYRGKFGGKIVAVKKIPHHLKCLYEQEIGIFKEMDFSHPNIIVYHHSHRVKDSNFIVMELCHCSLAQYVGNCKEAEEGTKKNILLQTTTGLNYLHSKNCIHRDIKPDNILFTRLDATEKIWVKISDYGISRQMEDKTHATTTGSGTLVWGAPEMFVKDSHVSPKSDLFSLGNVFYYLLTWGHCIFHDVVSWFHCQPDMHKLQLDSLERCLIERLISKEAQNRPNAEYVLRHPFFWTEQKIVDFLSDLSRLLENKGSPAAQYVEELMVNESSIIQDILKANWITQLDVEISSQLNIHRGKKNLMNETSIVDLIRAIRNKAIHYESLTEEEKNIVGPFPQGFCRYWMGKFPRLVTYLWEKFDDIKMEGIPPEYREPAVAFGLTVQELQFVELKRPVKKGSRDTQNFLKAVVTGTIHDWSPTDGSEIAQLWLEKGLSRDIRTPQEQGLLHLAAQWNSPELIEKISQLDPDFNVDTVDIDGNSPLHIAAHFNSVEAARKLIYKNANLNLNNFSGFTPLHSGCLKNSKASIICLLQYEVTVNAKDHNGETPLHLCAKQNHWEIAQLLAHKKAKVNITNHQNQTPLHLCSEKDSDQVAKILMANGALVNAVDKKKESPLHYCSRKNAVKVAKFLLSNKADSNAKNLWGKTALHLSCIHNSTELACLLTKRTGASAIPDQQGRLPIHYCAIHDCKHIAKELMKGGSDYETRDAIGWTPIYYCSMNDSIKTAKLLLQKNIDINVTDSVGNSLLHACSWFNSTRIVAFLNENHPDLLSAQANVKNSSLDAPLHFCAFNDSKEVAEMLIAKGAKVDDGNSSDETPLHKCAASNSQKVANILIEKQAKLDAKDVYFRTPLLVCAENNSQSVAELLIDKGANIDCIDNRGRNLLYCCSENNSKEMVELLLRKKDSNSFSTGTHSPGISDDTVKSMLDVCAKNNSKDVAELLMSKWTDSNAVRELSRTLLFSCVEHNAKEMVQMLIHRGMDVNFFDKFKRNLLHICAENNSKEVAELLIQKGVHCNAADVLHKTPLHYCADKNSKQVAELLIKNGAIVYVADMKGRTPLSICRELGFKEMADVLLAHSAT